MSDFLEPGDESKIAESDDHEHDVGTVKETEVSEELAVNEKTVYLGALSSAVALASSFVAM